MINSIFKERMKLLLGDEYAKFEYSLENGDAVKGVRINKIKAKALTGADLDAFSLEALPYAEDGYIINGAEGIGHTPEHHAGIFYMQDPGAMASVCSLDVKEGWRVLDLCAAPGGKSGQAAARIGDGGFLISNEYVPKRAKITVANLERLGIKNAFVTSLDTAEFKKYYKSYFDLVIADAPCSGEGMFRKSEEARAEWSEENVRECASRQCEILNNAAPLVRGGGYLLYSTCTYSYEENEAVVREFLSAHPDYSLQEVKDELKAVTADGIVLEGDLTTNLYKTRRFYPHIAKGEGQYIALMRRDEGVGEGAILYKDASSAPSNAELQIIEQFFKENLVKVPSARVRKANENLVLISHGVPLLPRSVFSAGVLIGEIRGRLLFPSHQLFSAYGELFKRRVELDSQAVSKYLRGEEIDAPSNIDNGWCVISYLGASLGGGKISSGKIKNHYPKGLRNN